MKTTYKTKHRRAESKREKLSDKADGVDVMARLHGKKISPRCPNCHQIHWDEASESYPHPLFESDESDDWWCSCGREVSFIYKDFRGDDE